MATRMKMEKDSKVLGMFSLDDSSKGQLEQEFQDAGNIHADEDLKVVPQIFSEYTNQVPAEGNIVEIVEGPKKFSRIFVDEISYAYRQNKKRRGGTFLLRCHFEGCSGSGIFKPDTTAFQRLTKHTHYPNHNTVHKLRFLQRVKSRAENETTSLSTIYQEEASGYEGVPIPAFERIKSTLRKRRKAVLIPNYLRLVCDEKETNLTQIDPAESQPQSVATHYIARKGMEIIEGPKRFSKIFIDDHGYCYLINRKKPDGGLILRCHEEGCRGSGRYQPKDATFCKMAKHSHYADPLLVTKWRFLHKCKDRAETETTPIKTIYEEESIRHSNCNLPSFKKIESTLQKRRKSQKSKIDENHKKVKSNDEPSKTLDIDSPELEIQLQEVYHPEGNPQYFTSPNIISNDPSSSKKNVPTPIIVRTGKPLKLNFPLGRDESMPNFLTDNSHKPEHISKIGKPRKPLKKRGRKRKDEKVKVKRKDRFRKFKALEPRIPSNYKSKMEVMEGMKRFSKIFIDEALHIYQLNKTRADGPLILKCYETSCHGSGVYHPKDELFKRTAEHHHEPSPELVAKCRLLSIMKTRAESENGPLRAIYEEEAAKSPDVEIPSFRRMESTLQKRRRAKIPAEPQSLKEAVFQLRKTEFSKCSRGNFFKAYLSAEGSEVLVFASPGLLQEKLMKAKNVHFDSSFKVIPQGFSQVLLVHLVMENHVFPVVYALMTKKCYDSYMCLFQFLKTEFEGFNPRTITTDYDFELENTLQAAFPGAIINGCWFHYTQAVWRSIRTFGLAQIFFQDERAKSLLKCVMALPLLPSTKVAEGMFFLQSKNSNSQYHLNETKNLIEKVTDYVNDSWVQRIGVHRLSVYGCERKMNYDLEAVYQYFIKKLGVETPSLIKFVEKIFQAEAKILSDFHKKAHGKDIRMDRSRRLNDNEKLIKDNCEKLEMNSTTVEQFLEFVSSAVPRHCHHDDICEEEHSVSFEDPSDIPHTLPFCEIRVMEPTISAAEMISKPLIAGLALSAQEVEINKTNDGSHLESVDLSRHDIHLHQLGVTTSRTSHDILQNVDANRKHLTASHRIYHDPLHEVTHQYLLPHSSNFNSQYSQPHLIHSQMPATAIPTLGQNIIHHQSIPNHHNLTTHSASLHPHDSSQHTIHQPLPLQHNSQPLHVMQSGNGIPESHTIINETQNICEVQVIDGKNEVYLYYPQCHKS